MEQKNKLSMADDSLSKVIQTFQTATYVIVWIILSAFMIMFNKYILSFAGFPFPIALTLMHMAFSSVLSHALVLLGVTGTANMEIQSYTKNVLPIAVLFASSLWLGNTAYLHLSVSFIQMLKALTPTTVYLVGVLFSIESCSLSFTLNMLVITVGVAVASYGEISFSTTGIIFQGGAIMVESYKLVLTQILLQGQGVELNPLSTLYYVAPACFSFLCFPFFILEFPRLLQADLTLHPVVLLGNAVGAFVLNLAVYLVIGRASALSMNVAGVIKDWLLILLSAVLFSSPVSKLQLFGYAIAFLGICWYKYQKIRLMNQEEPSLARMDLTSGSVEGGNDQKMGLREK